jgi:hypothetical protein
VDGKEQAERAFLQASIAVWREIDRLMLLGPYPGIPMAADLRITEKVAWEQYREFLDFNRRRNMAIVRVRPGGAEHAKLISRVQTAKHNRQWAKDEELWVEIGVPVEPRAAWECGTDLVWPVLRVVKPADLTFESGTHVCRHEIEAGD